MLLCPAMALTLFAWLGNCYFAEYELPLRASGGAIFCLRNICIRYLLGRLIVARIITAVLPPLRVRWKPCAYSNQRSTPSQPRFAQQLLIVE